VKHKKPRFTGLFLFVYARHGA